MSFVGVFGTIIKTTYDISLDFQDFLLPLGFLSLLLSAKTLKKYHKIHNFLYFYCFLLREYTATTDSHNKIEIL